MYPEYVLVNFLVAHLLVKISIISASLVFWFSVLVPSLSQWLFTSGYSDLICNFNTKSKSPYVVTVILEGVPYHLNISQV